MNTNILNITHAPKTNAKRNSCEADRTFRLYGNLLIQIKMYTVRNEMHYENATLMETNMKTELSWSPTQNYFV